MREMHGSLGFDVAEGEERRPRTFFRRNFTFDDFYRTSNRPYHKNENIFAGSAFFCFIKLNL